MRKLTCPQSCSSRSTGLLPIGKRITFVIALSVAGCASERAQEDKSASRRVPNWAIAAAGATYDSETGLPKTVVHKTTGIELVLVPAGSFMMGGRYTSEAADQSDRVGAVEIKVSHFAFGFVLCLPDCRRADAAEEEGGVEPRTSTAEKRERDHLGWIEKLR